MLVVIATQSCSSDSAGLSTSAAWRCRLLDGRSGYCSLWMYIL